MSHKVRESKPSFIIRPRRQLIDEGGTAKFKTSFDGEPLPTVRWEKNGSELINGAKYKIYEKSAFNFLEVLAVTLEDNGDYVCVISNPLGTQKVSAELECFATKSSRPTTSSMPQKAAPSVDKELTDCTVMDGKSLKLECHISGYPKPFIQWNHNGRILRRSLGGVEHVEENIVSLSFPSVTAKHAGKFECVASNSAGEVKTSCKVVIAESKDDLPQNPSSPLLRSPTTTKRLPLPSATELPAERQEPTLPSSPPPTRIKRLSANEYKFDETSKSVDKPGTNAENTVKYEIKSESLKSKLEGIVKDSVRDDEQVKSVFTPTEVMTSTISVHKPLQNLTISDGRLAKLECEINGISIARRNRSHPVIRWSKEGCELVSSDNIRMSVNGDRVCVEILRCTSADVGEYRCDVTCGTTTVWTSSYLNVNLKREIYKIASVEVSEPTVELPRLVEPVEKTDLVKPEEKADSVEPVERAKSVEPVENAESVEPVEKAESVSEHSEESEESEKSENQLNIAEPVLKSVLYDPISDTPHTGQRPEFIISLNDLQIDQGQDVELQVKVKGDEPMEICWLHDDLDLKGEESQYTLSSEGSTHSLLIKGVQASHSGVYICEAYNKFGDNETSCILSVIELAANRPSELISDNSVSNIIAQSSDKVELLVIKDDKQFSSVLEQIGRQTDIVDIEKQQNGNDEEMPGEKPDIESENVSEVDDDRSSEEISSNISGKSDNSLRKTGNKSPGSVDSQKKSTGSKLRLPSSSSQEGAQQERKSRSLSRDETPGVKIKHTPANAATKNARTADTPKSKTNVKVDSKFAKSKQLFESQKEENIDKKKVDVPTKKLSDTFVSKTRSVDTPKSRIQFSKDFGGLKKISSSFESPLSPKSSSKPHLDKVPTVGTTIGSKLNKFEKKVEQTPAAKVEKVPRRNLPSIGSKLGKFERKSAEIDATSGKLDLKSPKFSSQSSVSEKSVVDSNVKVITPKSSGIPTVQKKEVLKSEVSSAKLRDTKSTIPASDKKQIRIVSTASISGYDALVSPKQENSDLDWKQFEKPAAQRLSADISVISTATKVHAPLVSSSSELDDEIFFIEKAEEETKTVEEGIKLTEISRPLVVRDKPLQIQQDIVFSPILNINRISQTSIYSTDNEDITPQPRSTIQLPSQAAFNSRPTSNVFTVDAQPNETVEVQIVENNNTVIVKSKDTAKKEEPKRFVSSITFGSIGSIGSVSQDDSVASPRIISPAIIIGKENKKMDRDTIALHSQFTNINSPIQTMPANQVTVNFEPTSGITGVSSEPIRMRSSEQEIIQTDVNSIMIGQNPAPPTLKPVDIEIDLNRQTVREISTRSVNITSEPFSSVGFIQIANQNATVDKSFPVQQHVDRKTCTDSVSSVNITHLSSPKINETVSLTRNTITIPSKLKTPPMISRRVEDVAMQAEPDIDTSAPTVSEAKSLFEAVGQQEKKSCDQTDAKATQSDNHSGKPSFMRRPKSVNVDEGNSTHFVCQVKGHPPPDVQWQKDGVILAHGDRFKFSQAGNTHTFEISHALSTDAGRYLCLISNEFGTEKCSVSLVVKQIENTEVTDFRGLLKARPQLKTFGEPVETDKNANKPLGGEQRDFRGVLRRHTAVQEQPKFLTILNDLEVTEGQQARMEVKVIGTPTPRVVWCHENNEIKESLYFKMSYNPSTRLAQLIIAEAFQEDEGIYTCKADSEAGYAEISCKLKVKESAILSRESQFTATRVNSDSQHQTNSESDTNGNTDAILSIIHTSSQQFSPSQSGNRNSSHDQHSHPVEYSKQTHGIFDNGGVMNKSITVTKSTKVIQNRDDDDDDDETQETKRSTENKLKHQHNFDNSSLEAAKLRLDLAHEEPPMILNLLPQSLNILKGNVVRLEGTYVGAPQPTVRWFVEECRTRTELHSDKRIKIECKEGHSVLKIHAAEEKDTGIYTLEISNHLGYNSLSSSVTVEDKPDPPISQPFVSNIRKDSLTLSWYGSSYDGGSPILTYRVEMRRDKQTEWTILSDEVEHTSYNVSGLDPNEGYEFRVRAGNRHGFGEPSKASDVIFTMEIQQNESAQPVKPVEITDELPFEPRVVEVKKDLKFEDQYQIAEQIGRGKFGCVYKCHDKTSGRKFAAKFIKAARVSQKQDVMQEVLIMNCLHHPKLLLLWDAFESRKEIVLVMEHIGGGELLTRVVDEDYILTERECVHFMRQICDGVKFIHDQKVVHLDLKPENVMCITKNSNEIKIIDFGLARKLDMNKDNKVMFGTAEFVAPEVVNYDAIGLGTDMWSVGVICYILLSGLSPFAGENDAETFSNVTTAQFDFDEEEFEEISEDAKDFIEQLLQQDLKKRMSAKNCLKHPWLAQDVKYMKAKRLSTEKHKRFLNRMKWRKAKFAVEVINRMQKAVSASFGRSSSKSSLSSSHSGSNGSPFSDAGGSSPGDKPDNVMIDRDFDLNSHNNNGS